MKTLIIFALIGLISYSKSQLDPTLIQNYIFKCPDDKKIKIGEDVCAIVSNEKGSINSYDPVIYIKKKSCGKKKECSSCSSNFNIDNPDTSSPYDSVCACKKKLKLLKIKKKCNYNAECKTGVCSGGKCASFGKCYSSSDYSICGPGKYCKGYDSVTDTDGTCTDYVNEGGSCANGEKCAPGLECDLIASTKTCKKKYSLGKGESSNYLDYCKTGFLASSGKCAALVSVEKDCSIKINDGTSDFTLSVSTNSYLAFTTPDGKNSCKYSTGFNDLLDELVKRYNKIKLNKILEKEDCDYGNNLLCDKKYAELYNVYKNYGYLYSQGLIKENGKKNGDKKCEYEFWRSTISSSYVSIYFGFVFALLALLF